MNLKPQTSKPHKTMPSYAIGNPHLQKVWAAKVRKINRMFKELEQEQSAPRIRIRERA